METIYSNKEMHAIYSLIENYSEMYDLTFQVLMPLDALGLQNEPQFIKTTKRLNILSHKCERIINKLNSNFDIVENYDLIDSVINETTNDLKKRESIRDRLMYIDTLRAIEGCFSWFDSEEDEEFESIFENSNEEKMQTAIYNDLCLGFIVFSSEKAKSSARLLMEKYRKSFQIPDIERDLIITRFNPDNLIVGFSKYMAEELKISEEEYKILFDETCYEYIQEKINDLQELAHEQSNKEELQQDTPNFTKIENTLDEIAFAITKLSSQDILIIADTLNYLSTSSTCTMYDNNTSIFEKALSILEEELTNREDYKNTELGKQKYDDKELEQQKENTFCRLTPSVIDNLFEIIKVDAQIYEIMFQLSALEAENQTNNQEFSNLTKSLKYLVKKEKAFANKIDLSDAESDAIMDVLSKSINIIAGPDKQKTTIGLVDICSNESSNNRNELIISRITKLIPTLDTDDDSEYLNPDVPYAIVKNVQIKTLQEFETHIKHTSQQDRIDYVRAKYEELFSVPDLTDDYISTKGNLNEISWFSEETIISILGIDQEEYEYDKNNLLEQYITQIFHSLSEDSDEEVTSLEKARIQYRTVCLEVALSLMDDEYFEENTETFKLEVDVIDPSKIIETKELAQEIIETIDEKYDEEKENEELVLYYFTQIINENLEEEISNPESETTIFLASLGYSITDVIRIMTNEIKQTSIDKSPYTLKKQD